MVMHRQIAGKLTGRVTKWIVLAFWLILVVGSCWVRPEADRRPEQRGLLLAARQRRVHQGAREAGRRSRTRTPSPPWSSTSATHGLTEDDLAAAREQVAEMQNLDGVEGEVFGPQVSEDGQAAQTVVTFNFGANGWMEMPDAADELRDITEIDGVTTHIAGAGGQAADASEAFEGIDSTLLFGHPGRGDRDPAADLPQPGALGPAHHLRRLRADRRAGADLLPRQVRRPHGQRPEPGDPHDPGDRRRHRLRPAARRPLPRGAAPSRGPARGDGLRPAPGGAGDRGQRRDGDARHALPALRRDELHRRPGPGGGHRHRRDAPGDDHAPACAARDPRPLGLLAEASDVRFARAHPDRSVGPRRSADRRCARRAVWVVTALLLAVACLGLFRLEASGLSTEDSYTKEFDSIVGQKVLAEHGLFDAVQHRPGGGQRRRRPMRSARP